MGVYSHNTYNDHILFIGLPLFSGLMTSAFFVKITDDKRHRIVIDPDVWKKENLKKGDYLRVIIEKVK